MEKLVQICRELDEVFVGATKSLSSEVTCFPANRSFERHLLLPLEKTFLMSGFFSAMQTVGLTEKKMTSDSSCYGFSYCSVLRF